MIVAIVFLALVFMIALVVNTAQLFTTRRAAQEAADAAALAGGFADLLGADPTQMVDAAKDAAARNGYAAGPGVVVDAHRSPSSGKFRGDSGYFEVTITVRVDATLVPQWGVSTVTARAVARTGSAASVGSNDAVMAMDTGNTRNALAIANGGELRLVCGNVQVNSTGDQAARNQGGTVSFPMPMPAACAPSQQTRTIDVAGGVRGSWPPNTVASNCTPGPSCKAVQQDDPYLGRFSPPIVVAGQIWCLRDPLDDPAVPQGARCGSPVAGNFNGCSGPPNNVLHPGLYVTSISGNCDWKLMPGVYIFAGNQSGISNPASIKSVDTSGVSCSAQAAPPAQPLRCGVTLFFTYATYADTDPTDPFAVKAGGCASLNISGGNPYDLVADTLTLSRWRGVLIYYDPHDDYCATQNASISFGGGAAFTTTRGVIYAPTVPYGFNGSGSQGKLSQAIAKTVNVQNGTLIVDVSQVSQGGVGQPVQLVE